MTVPAPDRRLLLMMKAPEPGRVKTRLAAEIGPELATRYYRRFVEFLVRGILAAPLRSWRSIVVFDPPEARSSIESWLRQLAPFGLSFEIQSSGDLGERLTDAFRSAFSDGATAVVAIGTDCLDLTPEEIEACFSALETHEAVMGEAEDGGYWIIGLSGPYLALFEGMPWSRPDLAEATRLRAQARGWRLAERDVRMDVDRRADLDRLPRFLKNEIGLAGMADQ